MSKVFEGKTALVRTTLRLPRDLYERLKHRAIAERRPLQKLIIADLDQAEKRQTVVGADKLFKYTIRQGKRPGMPRYRGDLYA